MTSADKRKLLLKFNSKAPAGASSIRQFEMESGFRLPGDYVQFLRKTNGGEGFVGNAYLILWRIEELLEMNRDYQVAEFAPGLFLFGSNGGGEAFAFDMRSDAMPIVSVPFVGMELSSILAIAPNFKAFLEALFRS